jgi:hypothetical protein
MGNESLYIIQKKTVLHKVILSLQSYYQETAYLGEYCIKQAYIMLCGAILLSSYRYAFGQVFWFLLVHSWKNKQILHLLWIVCRMRRSRITNSSMAALEGAQIRILGRFLWLPCLWYSFWPYRICKIRFTMTCDLPVPEKQLCYLIYFNGAQYIKVWGISESFQTVIAVTTLVKDHERGGQGTLPETYCTRLTLDTMLWTKTVSIPVFSWFCPSFCLQWMAELKNASALRSV